MLDMNSQGTDIVEGQQTFGDADGKTVALDILVVDDEPSILELVKVALENLESHSVTTANGAEAAMRLLQDENTHFDCLLLDIQMPDINGIQLLKSLRQLPGYADTPVIMLTAMSERKYIDEAFIEGATDYVSKPFDFFELRGRIRCAHTLIEARSGSGRPEAAEPRPGPDATTATTEPPETGEAEPILQEPLSVTGIQRILRDVEFDNYLDQLARQKLLKSQAIAVKLKGADTFLREHGEEALRGALHLVATSIQYATKDMDRVFSYRGSGVFIVIVHGRRIGSVLSSLQNLNEVIGLRLTEQLADAPVRCAVGKPVPMTALSRTRASRAILEAIDDVHKQPIRPVHDPVLRTPERTKAPYRPVTRSEDRLYEKVLQELYGKASYLRVR